MSDKFRRVLHAFSALADLGAEIAETNDFDEMAESALHVVLGALGVRRGAVAEFDRLCSSLKFVAARGFGETLLNALPFAEIEARALESSDTDLIKILGDETWNSSSSSFSSRALASFQEFEMRLLMPMFVRRDFVGLILLGEKASGDDYTTEEHEVVRALGRHIGVGLHNHRLLREVETRANENRKLYDDLRAIYNDTVRAFAAAIDCKDKYTQGHSERVGKYSEIIAREMGWKEEEVEGIAIAGYLHDIGKLVVDRDIINAPYKIDAKQSSELNRHPAAGFEILSPINHPYADIPLMARFHHERIDGRGYPLGLKGDEIPIGAKIVSLADSFDAMTTDRPYKRRRSFDEVVEDLRRNTNKQFAPEVVLAFCRALLKEVNGQTRPREISKLLGKGYLEEHPSADLLSQLISELEGEPQQAAHTV